MKRPLFLLSLAILILLEQYLRLVSNWPIILVPELIIAFTIINYKNQGNLSVTLLAIFLYDFWGASVPGATMITLVGVVLLLYILSSRVDLRGNFLFTILATLIAFIVYIFVVNGLNGLFLQKTIRSFALTSYPSFRSLGLLLVEAICVIFLIKLKGKSKKQKIRF